MTVSSTGSTVTALGNGLSSSFQFPFIAVSETDIAVIYTDTSGTLNTLSPSQYSVALNPAGAGQLWGVGGTVTYPLSGSPIANGESLTISRVLPLTQDVTIRNQGRFYPDAIERAIDILCMEVQQVAARTGQFRGTWATGNVYNFGDIVQDGANGSNSGSYYMCSVTNTSTVWSTDLAAGYWQLIIQSTLPAASLPLSIANGGTGQITGPLALAALGGISLGGNNVYTGSNNFAGVGGSIAVPTAGAGDNSPAAASTAFVNGTALTLADGTIAVTQSAGNTTDEVATCRYVTSQPTINQANLVGTTTNNDAAAGSVGEFATAEVLNAGAVSLVTNVAKTIVSKTLSAGDWDVWGTIVFKPAASTTYTAAFVSVSSTNNTEDSFPAGGSSNGLVGGSFSPGGNLWAVASGVRRYSLAANTPIYLIAKSVFATSTLAVYGQINARRVR